MQAMIGSAVGAVTSHLGTAGAAAATGAATATGVGTAAYTYNRANYMFDAGMRFGRYCSGYSFAIAQASMYREDIRDFTALTVTKQDTYHVLGVIFFVLNFQLIMAGRLGVHGPSPPGWLLGLYWGNISSALMFLTIFNWLAMHASARATSGGVHMLTRSVRLPIPTPKQLDKARKTANTFERQRVNDVFRVPFVAPAPKDAVVECDSDASDSSSGGKKGGKQAAGTKRRIPRWHHDEKAALHTGVGNKQGVPEHFELYRGLVQEWWGHDVYARVGMMVFIDNWLVAASLYSQSHCFGELRQMWPAWTVTFMFVTANFCVLHMDVIATEHNIMPPIEYLKPFHPILCVLGMSLDYSIAEPTAALKAFIYFLSWICYFTQFAWALRLMDLAWPFKRAADDQEAPGQPWHSSEFWVPPALQGICYLVTPPKQLEKGQFCLQQEMKACKKNKGGDALQAKEIKEPQLFAWRVFRGALCTYLAIWVFIMFGRVIEQTNGERQLLKQEGRVERWPSHMQPWMPPWTREGSRNEWSHTGGSDRRLMAKEAGFETNAWTSRVSLFGNQHEEVAQASKDRAASQAAQELMTALAPIMEALEQPRDAAAASLLQPKLSWPAQLQPTVLAPRHGTNHIAALARDHQGALVALAGEQSTIPFSLQGIADLGDVLGASWGDAGLLLATANGALAECPGFPTDGRWTCAPIAHRLPRGDSQLQSASAARVPGTGSLRVALSFADEDAVALFELDAKGQWLPTGEVQLSGKGHFSLSPSADELLVGHGDGSVLSWPLSGAEPMVVAVPQKASLDSHRAWHASCGMGDGRVAHLASSLGKAAVKELLISARA